MGVVQGSSVQLEVFVSGYPPPTQITWYRPHGYEVMTLDEGVEFQDGRKKLLLSNILSQDAGLYTCTVTLMTSLPQSPTATTRITLDVYGEWCLK